MARRETSTNGGGATAPGCTTETLDLHFQGRPHAIASFLLSGDGEAALIESGPGSTLTALMRGLAASGVEPELVTKILLTHIHLDHAGAAGELTELLPNAVVYVHGIGAPHLLDPSRLLRSAERIYGDQMDPLWGTMHPVPEKRLVVLEDGDVVEAAGRTLRAIYTPGHASHHVAFHDADAGVLFAGDVAGVRLPGLDRVMPPTPPPELNLELWSESINRMLALDLNTLYLTHFGPVHNVADHLDELHIRMYS
ncbi:MAG: MBL fold metallo-hydrolase, partial [Chloroflexia bacterium]